MKQEVYLVVGGKLKAPVTDAESIEFIDATDLHFVGSFDDHGAAHKAWLGAAQRTVDDAHMRYFIVPMHESIK